MTGGQPVVCVLVVLAGRSMSASSMVAGQKPSSAENSRSLSVSIVIACVGARPCARWLRQRLTQRALHLANRITTPPHRPNQSLLFDVKPNRTRTHPDLHQHIIIIGLR